MVVGVNGVGRQLPLENLRGDIRIRENLCFLELLTLSGQLLLTMLTIWSERAGVPLVKQQMGSDPASVAFDAVSSGKSSGADIIYYRTQQAGYIIKLT
jgi:fused signal recognition particle receptor